MVSALAWPLTAVVVIFALRKSIIALVPKIEEFNLGPLKMKIKQELAEAKELARQVDAQLGGEISEASLSVDAVSSEEKRRQLANLSPEAAVLSQWIEIEYMLKQLAVEKDLNPRSPLSKILEQLVKTEALDAQNAKLFRALRAVRNEVAHANIEYIGLDTNSALDYMMLADILLDSLKAALGKDV